MLNTVTGLLALTALGTAIICAMGMCPIWVPVILLTVIALLGVFKP